MITRVFVCVPWVLWAERQGWRAPAAKDFQHLVEVPQSDRLTGGYSLNHPAPDQPPGATACSGVPRLPATGSLPTSVARGNET